MIRCDLIRAITVVSIPFSFILGRLSLPQLYAVALLEGSAKVLFEVAEISALPRIVAPKRLAQAYALTEGTDAAANVFGPGLGGLIMSLARTTHGGAALAYLVDSLSYLCSALVLSRIRTPFQGERAVPPPGELSSEIRAGLRFLWSRRRLRQMALLAAAVNLTVSQSDLAVIVLARSQLHVSVALLGLLLSAGGVGSLLGSVLAGPLRVRLGTLPLLASAVAAWALSMVLLAAAHSTGLLLAGVVLDGAIWPVYSVVLVTYRLQLTPDGPQGRVNAAFRVFTFGVNPLGLALGGVLLGAVGPRPLLWGLAAALLAITFTLVPPWYRSP